MISNEKMSLKFRVDNDSIWYKVNRARELIFEKCISPGAKRIAKVLSQGSLTPVRVSVDNHERTHTN